MEHDPIAFKSKVKLIKKKADLILLFALRFLRRHYECAPSFYLIMCKDPIKEKKGIDICKSTQIFKSNKRSCFIIVSEGN